MGGGGGKCVYVRVCKDVCDFVWCAVCEHVTCAYTCSGETVSYAGAGASLVTSTSKHIIAPKNNPPPHTGPLQG